MMQSFDLKPRIDGARNAAAGERGRPGNDTGEIFAVEIEARAKRGQDGETEVAPNPGPMQFPIATLLANLPNSAPKPVDAPEPGRVSQVILQTVEAAPEPEPDDAPAGLIRDVEIQVHFDTTHLQRTLAGMSAVDEPEPVILASATRQIETLLSQQQPLKVIKLELDGGTGAVTATLRLREQNLAVRIEADRGVLRSDVRDHAERLTQALNDAGYVTETVIVESTPRCRSGRNCAGPVAAGP